MCHKSIDCEYSLVKSHLKIVHKIHPQEYCTITGCTIDYSGMHFYSSKSFLKSLQVSKNVGNFCVFKCEMCEKKFNTLSSLYSHNYREHKRNNKSPSSVFFSGRSFKCTKCHALMLCEKSIIENHKRTVHGIRTDFNRSYAKFRESFLKDVPVSSKVWKKPTLPVKKNSNQRNYISDRQHVPIHMYSL